MKLKLRHSKKSVFLLEAITFVIISIVYVFIIKDMYGYMGHDHDIKIAKVIIGWLFFIPMLFLGTKVKGDFFYTIWHVIFVLYFFGQVMYYQFNDGIIQPVFAHSILLLVLFVCSFFKLNFSVIHFKGQMLSIVLLISIVLFVPIFIKYLPHVKLKNLLLADVYETRYYFREIQDRYFGYLSAPLSRVILPSLLIIGIVKKKFWLVGLSIFMISFIFLIGALKSIFIGMIAAVFFFKGKAYIDKLHYLLYLFFGLCFLGLLVFIITDNTFLVNSFVRRVLFTPARMDNSFYSFFGENPTFWSHNSIGEYFMDYPLEQSPNYYVGEVLLEKEGLNANVGLITEGYFSFGYIGVILHSLFIGFVFLILKHIKMNPIFFGLVFVYIYYMNTSFFTTLLLTHGLAFFVFFAYLFLNKDYER
ncbi:oligosaccharide repeat unit polymerase [Maribacter polysiphoniae]|uniref:Oligosaccharide repeat unit polymerase n=1 Tax=Maribacter polysiphoniae TaxID=429344 RepID=A0A316E7V3_9FLAO|nr:oligosaccharide repeat unit polymerase [Maribacter polysiphoniae]MBD1260011.1 oligosaccharide repeat unit polymerase [Maribacter polysiphoniae]PWK25469.1 hypothetical protein LX92_00208 [Maribacter polysiphoniae]